MNMGVSSTIRLIAACSVSLSAGLIGSLGVADGFATWYSAIEKPAFTPPNWVFGPVWTVLYLLMGVAAFLVWQKGLRVPAVRVALSWFLVQLVLNALWTPVFFGLHRIDLALVCDRAALGGHRDHHVPVPEGLQACRRSSCPLPALGVLCDDPEHRDLAPESLTG
jgi:tryptophan-rich sensory protein